MTAISRCLATQHPCPQLTEEAGEMKLCTRPGCPEIIQECYRLRRGDAGTIDKSEIDHHFQAEYVLARLPGSTTKTVPASAITVGLPRCKIFSTGSGRHFPRGWYVRRTGGAPR